MFRECFLTINESIFEENFLSNFEQDVGLPVHDSTQIINSSISNKSLATNQDSNQVNDLLSSLNNLNLDPDLQDEAWFLTKSQTGAYKCYSMGYAYTVDKPKQSEVPTATKIYWRCEKYSSLKLNHQLLQLFQSIQVRPIIFLLDSQLLKL